MPLSTLSMTWMAANCAVAAFSCHRRQVSETPSHTPTVPTGRGRMGRGAIDRAPNVNNERRIEKGNEVVIEYIRTHAIAVENNKEIAQLASISAADESIGQLIADVIKKVTTDGIITVEASQGTDVEVEYVEGMQLDRGYISPYFVTDQAKMEASLENPYILITDKKISAIYDLGPILEEITQQGRRDLLIIAQEGVSEALTTLVVNKTRGILNVLAVRAPSFGDRRKDVMREIALLTGGAVFNH